MTQLAKASIQVFGRVQGVFFRQTTKQKASSLNLDGWVKNLDDGSVKLEVVGPKEKVDALISWCWQGPPQAQVTEVKVLWQAVNKETLKTSFGFEIA